MAEVIAQHARASISSPSPSAPPAAAAAVSPSPRWITLPGRAEPVDMETAIALARSAGGEEEARMRQAMTAQCARYLGVTPQEMKAIAKTPDILFQNLQSRQQQ
jgi:hypothetical protein